MDKLIDCKRCGGNACYEQHIDETLQTWLCMGCGWTTSSIMLEGSKVAKDLEETSPELYKDLLFLDDQKRIWAPSTITLPGKGMVFLDGTSKTNWLWSAVKSIDLTEEEIKSGKFPEGQTIRMDMVNAKKFNQGDYMDAMESIGFFEAS